MKKMEAPAPLALPEELEVTEIVMIDEVFTLTCRRKRGKSRDCRIASGTAYSGERSERDASNSLDHIDPGNVFLRHTSPQHRQKESVSSTTTEGIRKQFETVTVYLLFYYRERKNCFPIKIIQHSFYSFSVFRHLLVELHYVSVVCETGKAGETW